MIEILTLVFDFGNFHDYIYNINAFILADKLILNILINYAI